MVARARLALWAAAGESDAAIAERLGWSMPTVGKWRQRSIERRVAGLRDELRPGRPRTYDDERVAGLVNRVLRGKPSNATQWSARTVAEETEASKSTEARYFALFGLQPHRSKRFKLSTGPFFVEKVRDVAGLYLNPPDKALALYVDEKSRLQARERTQPAPPMGLGYVEGVTHDYYRHGAATLFAALNVLDGSVIAQCKPRHRHQEFLGFLDHPDRNAPSGLEIHLIADNYAAHKRARVKAWLARHPRAITCITPRHTPAYSSWPNQVERWFGLIAQRAIRRGSFRGVRELALKIGQYVTCHNLHHRPFAWTATLGKLRTGRRAEAVN